MRDVIRHDEIDNLIDALRPLAHQCKTETAYWITVDGGEYLTDNGNEWCYECGTKEVEKLKAENPDKDEDYYFLDGGWDSEHDTPPMCAHCGVKLRASLLFYGGTYELDHFRDHPPEPGNVDHAYEISEMLSALQYTRPADAYLAEEAIQIARALIASNEAGRSALAEGEKR